MGDERFTSIISQFQPLIAKIAAEWEPTFRYLRIPITADDLKQEMALAIYFRFGSFDRRRAKLATWMKHICTSRMHDVLDTETRQKRMPSSGLVERSSRDPSLMEIILTEQVSTPLEELECRQAYQTLYEQMGNIRYKPPSAKIPNDKSFAQLLFFELVNPSPELVEQIRKKCDELDELSLKDKRNRRAYFRITKQDLATFFNVKISCISTCLKFIHKATRRYTRTI